MRTIDSSIITQMGSGAVRPFLLLEMNIDGTHYYYTDCDVPIAVSGCTYTPRGFKLEPIRYSMNDYVDSMRFATDNLDDTFTSAFVGGTPHKGLVKLSMAVFDTAAVPSIIDVPVPLFEGIIDEWSLNESEVSITVSSLLVTWNNRTLAKHSSSCRWKQFKGRECGYRGTETWCDRSYTRCAALGNQANFGGFRWLPSIADKEVWWGRNRG